MGDPRKTRKKYKTPSHPWQKARIEEEKALVKEYGLKNKKEIWKMVSVLRTYMTQVKRLIAARGAQAETEKGFLFAKLQRYGLYQAGAPVASILELNLRNILERRLQTQVYKKNLARSMKQARQFIIHQHITVNNKPITMPSYLVPVSEESMIGFVSGSALNDPEHPERAIKSESEVKKEHVAEQKEETGSTTSTVKQGNQRQSKKSAEKETPKTAS